MYICTDTAPAVHFVQTSFISKHLNTQLYICNARVPPGRYIYIIEYLSVEGWDLRIFGFRFREGFSGSSRALLRLRP